MDLSKAVQNNDASEVRSLLKQGANPNHQIYWGVEWYKYKGSFPPVHVACMNGHLEITKELVSGGADIEKGDGRHGMTAFHWACHKGRMEIMVYLTQNVKCRTGKCVCVCQ